MWSNQYPQLRFCERLDTHTRATIAFAPYFLLYQARSPLSKHAPPVFEKQSVSEPVNRDSEILFLKLWSHCVSIVPRAIGTPILQIPKRTNLLRSNSTRFVVMIGDAGRQNGREQRRIAAMNYRTKVGDSDLQPNGVRAAGEVIARRGAGNRCKDLPRERPRTAFGPTNKCLLNDWPIRRATTAPAAKMLMARVTPSAENDFDKEKRRRGRCPTTRVSKVSGIGKHEGRPVASGGIEIGTKSKAMLVRDPTCKPGSGWGGVVREIGQTGPQ